MTKHHLILSPWLAVSLVAIVFSGTGCHSIMKLSRAQSTQLTASPAPVKEAVRPEASVDNEDSVKALQSFLARTERYSLAPSDESSTRPGVSDSAGPDDAGNAEDLASRPSRRTPPVQKESPDLKTSTLAKAPPHILSANIVAPAPGSPATSQANETLMVSERASGRVPLAAPTVKSLSIRSIRVSSSQGAALTGKPRSIRVNEPADDSTGSLSPGLDEGLANLLERAASGSDAGAAWEAGLIHAALQRSLDAGSVSGALPLDIKPLFLAAIDLVRSLRRMVGENPTDFGDVLDRLDDLRSVVANQADPSVGVIALCRQVTTYGVFEEMAASAFVPGQPTPTIVYSELENLSAQRDKAGYFRTELATRIEVFTAAGDSVLSREEPTIVDRCRSHRHDFFIAQRITLPASIRAGDYVLKVFVEDKLAGRAAEGSYPFTVGTRTASIQN